MHFCLQCYATYPPSFTRCPRDGSILQDSKDPLIGQLLSERYRILSVLGTGGMGRVYLAEHVEMGKRFAIKVLFGHYALSDNSLARFRREAQTASLLNHISIVNVTDFGVTTSGLYFLVMGLLAGRPLSTVIGTEGPLPPKRAIHIGKQIAMALAHAHDKGILHRDLTPGNVFVEDREEAPDFVTVLDFGLAGLLHDDRNSKLTLGGTVVGTPEFMSPEQAQGFPLKPSSDLYSLGVLLYAMLSRSLPFPRAEDRSQILSFHVFHDPRPLSRVVEVPLSLEKIVMKLLAKKPSDRYETGRDVANALSRITERELAPLADSSPSITKPPSDSVERITSDHLPINQESERPISEPLVADTQEMPTIDLSAQEDTQNEISAIPFVLLEEAMYSSSDLGEAKQPQQAAKADILFYRGRFIDLSEAEPLKIDFTSPLIQPTDLKVGLLDRAELEEDFFSASDLAAVPPNIQQEFKARAPLFRKEPPKPTPIKPLPLLKDKEKLLIGDYQLIEKIKEGGMCSLYRAINARTRKEVAIKILHDETADAEALWRFFGEAHAANKIRHPNIIEIFDSGVLSDGKTRFLIMELLRGKDLENYLENQKVLPLNELRDFFIQICSGLVAAHNAGVIHRDLKPKNIFVCDNSRIKNFIKILDFGIAKISDRGNTFKTQHGVIIGTPAYMSPEQALNHPVDNRADIYNLGLLLFRCITGKAPFQGESVADLLYKHAFQPHPPISSPLYPVPPKLEALVSRCLEKSPEHRPRSSDEVLAEILNPETFEPGLTRSY